MIDHTHLPRNKRHRKMPLLMINVQLVADGAS